MPDRRPSTYKEEVLRHLHAMPRGQLQDSRVGVTRVLHEQLASRYPIMLGSISGILGALSQEHRVVLEFGHRSLDNRHLITGVTVLAEPMEGVTLAPDEELQPRVADLSGSTTDWLDPESLMRMIRQLIQRRIRDELVPLDTLQQVASHVKHLVEEINVYEQLIQEADEDQMAKQAEWEAREHDWVQLVEDAEMEAEKRVERAEQTAQQLRTRSHQHFTRIQELIHQLEQTKAVAETTKTELEEYRQRASTLNEKIEQLRHDLDLSHNQVAEIQARAETARDHYHRLIQVAHLREQHLVTETMRWAQLTAGVLAVAGAKAKAKVSDELVDTLKEQPPDSWAHFLMILGDWLRETDAAGEDLLQLSDVSGNTKVVNFLSFEKSASEIHPDSVLLVRKWLDQNVGILDPDPQALQWPKPEDIRVRDAVRAADLDRQLRHLHRIARAREQKLTRNTTSSMIVINMLLLILQRTEQYQGSKYFRLSSSMHENFGTPDIVRDLLIPLDQWTLEMPQRLMHIMTHTRDWIVLVDPKTDKPAATVDQQVFKALQGLARELDKTDYGLLLDSRVGPLRLPDD